MNDGQDRDSIPQAKEIGGAKTGFTVHWSFIWPCGRLWGVIGSLHLRDIIFLSPTQARIRVATYLEGSSDLRLLVSLPVIFETQVFIPTCVSFLRRPIFITESIGLPSVANAIWDKLTLKPSVTSAADLPDSTPSVGRIVDAAATGQTSFGFPSGHLTQNPTS